MPKSVKKKPLAAKTQIIRIGLWPQSCHLSTNPDKYHPTDCFFTKTVGYIPQMGYFPHPTERFSLLFVRMFCMQMETADVLDQPLRVLIVDDEPELRKLLKEIAERWKWEPVPVSRARDAFDRIRRGDIDIMLLDIQMPVVGGLGLVKAMKRHGMKCQEQFCFGHF